MNNYKLIDIDESYTEFESNDLDMKKRIIETLSVFEEGYRFNPLFRSGIWDGKKHFYTIEYNTNIRFPKGLVAYIIKDLIKHGHTYTYNTSSVEYHLDITEFEEFVKSLNLPFEPYDYQVMASYNMITKRRLTLRSATSSGKSLMAYLFFMYMYSKGFHSLLVVPSINLVDQMFSDFEDYGLENASELIKQIGGDHKGTKDLSEKPIVISTWQSLQRMNAKEFEIFDGIVIDECLDGDSLISMGDGTFKKIKDIKADDVVLTINETTNIIESKVVEKLHINIPSTEMYEIEVGGNILQVTGNHKINTKNGKKRVDELTTEDEIALN